LQNGAQISAKITKNFELSKKIGIFFHFWTIFGALFKFFFYFCRRNLHWYVILTNGTLFAVLNCQDFECSTGLAFILIFLATKTVS